MRQLRSRGAVCSCAARLLALLGLCCAAAQDTTGYGPRNDAADASGRPAVRVGAGVPGVRCAETAEELAPLLAVTLEADLAKWRRNYTMTDFHKLVNESGLRDWRQGERLVLIHNNSWYYYAHKQDAAVALPRGPTPEGRVHVEQLVHPWLTATQWWFEEAVSAWNMTFPDCVFHFDVQDHGHCALPRVCAAPSLALWRDDSMNATDIMVPYMYGINHSTYDVPWADKDPRAFFRGRRNEHDHVFPNRSVAKSRSTIVALTRAHNDTLDAHFVENDPDARPEVPIREHARYKYLLALDGITGSFRLSRLLWCNSLILKEASPWQEYFYRALLPGTHYRTVFESAPDDVLGATAAARATPADERAAQAVAAAGQAFAARYLCPRARVAYFHAALHAYTRLFPEGDMAEYARNVAWPAAQARIRQAALSSPLPLLQPGG